MFDGDPTLLSTADLLESAAEHRAVANRADARLLVHAQIYADRFHPDMCPIRPGRRACDGRERAVVLGGVGCPEIAEFAVAEFAVMLGVSPKVAADYLGTALALRHRFPFTWARVLAGEATAWKACRLVAECSKLSEEAARYVDKRVAGLIDSITPYRLEKIVKAAKKHADPSQAQAEADEKSRERGVWAGRSDDHGSKTMYINAPAAAVTRNDATIADIAEALKTFGDTRPVQHRRADAVGIIADPRYTEELLTQARKHRLNTTPAPDTTDPDATAADATAADTTDPDTTVADAIDPDTADSDAIAPDATTPPTATPNPATVDMAALGAGGAPHAAGEQASGAGSHSTTADQAPAAHPARSGGSAESVARSWGGAETRTESGSWSSDLDLLDHPESGWDEPGPDDEADRDAPHPSDSDLPDPLDSPHTQQVEPLDASDPRVHHDLDDGEPMDAAAMQALHARLAQIRHDAHSHPATPAGTGHTGCTGGAGRADGRVRPGQTEIYVHLTDHTLATGTGVLRAETIGPLLASQLTELVGHGPYTVKPVIDLNDAVSVNAYEIPDRIRERVKLTHPTELFPYGTRETNRTLDLDHIQPYDPLGPPGQTNTANLAPLGRFTHRVKTHAHGWNVHRIDHRTLEWTTPHGFTFHVTPTGTQRVSAPRRPPDLS